MFKEKKIATYSASSTRIQLLEMTDESYIINDIINQYGMPAASGKNFLKKYQIRRNRKIIKTFKFENIARKKFASIVTEEILKQKFSF